MIKKCKICQKEFETKVTGLIRGIYCSQKCRNLNRSYFKPKILKICPYCKSEFYAIIKKSNYCEKKYCSKECKKDMENSLSKERYSKNPEYFNGYSSRYYKENKDRFRIARTEYIRNRRRLDKEFRILCNLRKRVRAAFDKYQKHKIEYISRSNYYGIDYSSIIKRLMKSIPNDYNTRAYHIDHIRPLCSFDFNNLSEIKKAFSPENHQWLLAEDNLKKGGKYYEQK